VLEAAVGIFALVMAVSWLSGGCETRVEPGIASVPADRMESGDESAVVEEVVAAGIEWASGEVASARHTAIASRVLARIEEIRVRAGSRVEEGAILVVLDARDLQARAGEAQEKLTAARARLELARTEHERAEKLFSEGVGTRQQLDRATSELRAARADVQALEQALEEARTGLSFAVIRSPVSGRVIDRLAEPGDTAVPGTSLLRIYDPNLLRVEAPVRESRAVTLEVGQALRLEIDALGRTFEGTIDEIVPFAEPGARTLLVKVRLPVHDEQIFAGMFARVAIPAGESRRLLIPAGVVERIGQLEFVQVLGPEDALERRLVTTGTRADGDRVEVLSGLRAGERVRVASRRAREGD